MIDMLIPQSIRLKQKFTEKPPRLIEDYEIAAAIGLACRDLGEALPEGEDLAEIQRIFRTRDDIDPMLRKLIDSCEANGKRPDWRRILIAGYNYEG